MLNSLRRGAKTWLAKGLFALLILSFAAWGIGDYLQPDPAAPAAEVGELAISRDEINRDLNRELERMRQRFGDAIDRETAAQLGLIDQVLAQAINRRLLDLEARDLGVRVSDDLVRQRILAEPAFTTPTGQFDRIRFEQTLFANGLSEDAFVAMMRGDLARGMLADTVVVGATAPRTLTRMLYADEAESRVAEIVFLPDEAAGTPPEPTEVQLAEAYEAERERWMAPEYRAVTAVLLRPENLMAEVQVSEDRIREHYEMHRGEFVVPGRRTVSQLLFADETVARNAARRIAEGEDFDAVAADVVGKGGERTEIGTVTRDELFPAAVADAAFALEAAGATEPVRSPLGWHILRVSDIEPGHTVPLDEVRERVAQRWRAARLHEMGAARAADLAEKVRAGADLQALAAETGLTARTPPPVRRAANAPGERMPASLVRKLFAAQEGAVVVDAMPDGHVVARLTEVRKADLPAESAELERAREQIGDAMAADVRAQYLEALRGRFGVTVNQNVVRSLY
ncbi:MAG: SurA N-terminal domain-containing protein [Alphaproteobacteria bacterium]